MSGSSEIDAEVLVARERETCIDHDDLVAHLEDGHVLPTSPRPPSGMMRSVSLMN